jgi:hypothetical protein
MKKPSGKSHLHAWSTYSAGWVRLLGEEEEEGLEEEEEEILKKEVDTNLSTDYSKMQN